MIRRSVVVVMLALAALLALSGTISANDGEAHGGGGCFENSTGEGCAGSGGGGNDQAGGGGGGGKVTILINGSEIGFVAGGGSGGSDQGSGGGIGGCAYFEGERVECGSNPYPF